MYFLFLFFLTIYFCAADTKNNSVPSTFPESLNLEELIKNKEDMNEATFQSSYRKKWNDNVFFYFVTRILSGVNASITCFDSNKTDLLLSDIFSVSDEAYAIITIINEFHAWKEYGEKGKDERNPDKMKRRYVIPNSGRKHSWSKEGMNDFKILCTNIEQMRKDETTGKQLEEKLRDKFRESSIENGKKHCTMENDDMNDESFYISDDLKAMLNL